MNVVLLSGGSGTRLWPLSNKLSYILNKTEEILGSSYYKYFFNNYASFKKISFDYTVAERENSISVLHLQSILLLHQANIFLINMFYYTIDN